MGYRLNSKTERSTDQSNVNRCRRRNACAGHLTALLRVSIPRFLFRETSNLLVEHILEYTKAVICVI